MATTVSGRREGRSVFPGGDNVNRWLNDKDRVEGMNKRSAKYFREYKQAEREKGRNIVILYYLITRYNLTGCYSMFGSERKQKKYIQAVKMSLKEYSLEQRWERDFDKDLTNLKKRTDFVFRIIQENIRMTELYPFFREVGFDRLADFGVKYAKGDEEAADQLAAEISKWNAEHFGEVQSYMESIAEEKANMEAHRARIQAEEKAEKEAKRMLKKQERDEIKEIRENHRKYESRRKRVERSFDRYYK